MRKIRKIQTEDTFSDGSTDGDFDTNKNTSDNAAAEAGSEDIQTADAVSAENCRQIFRRNGERR